MSFFIFIVGADTGSGHSCCIQMQTRDRRSDGQDRERDGDAFSTFNKALF